MMLHNWSFIQKDMGLQAGGVTQVGKRLPSKFKTLSSTLSNTRERERERGGRKRDRDRKRERKGLQSIPCTMC
jgi:hypothetical protein